MERLWAPWRMAYISQGERGGCIFCDKPGESEEAAMIVARGAHAFLMMNAYPYNNGHLLVAPYSHVAELMLLSPEERLEVMDFVSLGVDLLADVCSPDGYNIGANLGRVAGAGVADHVHFHIVPRWNGDTNFMPVIADVKVIPEALEAVRGKLQAAHSERRRRNG